MPPRSDPRKGTKDQRQIVVRCSGEGHKVRLTKGRRFFAKARCPVCRAPVDHFRLQRIFRWVLALRHPVSPALPDRIAHAGVLGLLAAVALACFVMWTWGDRWWVATVLLFGPRWLLAVPLVALAPLVLIRDRALVPPLILAGWLTLVPWMGYETGLSTLFVGGAETSDLKVVSLNARGGQGMVTDPANLLREWGADIVAIQECDQRLQENLRQIPGWSMETRSNLCLLSRYEIVDAREMDRAALQFADGSGVVATFEVDLGGARLFVTNLHLETPREGFELLWRGRLAAGRAKVREKSRIRGIELRQAGAWADGFGGPQIVVGDFNTPLESKAFRGSWEGWENAFSVGGRGFGRTRISRWLRVRIDHILASEEVGVTGARIEGDVGSDHLPISATFRLKEAILTW